MVEFIAVFIAGIYKLLILVEFIQAFCKIINSVILLFAQAFHVSIFCKFETAIKKKMETLPLEILVEITQWVKGDFIAWTSTCRLLSTFNTVEQRAKRSNHLLSLLKMYLDAKWDQQGLSENPNISWDYVNSHPAIRWMHIFLSENSLIRECIDFASTCVKWGFYWLSKNPHLTLFIFFLESVFCKKLFFSLFIFFLNKF